MTTRPELRVGIVGLGNNTRLRHVPGFLQQENVRIVAVCNRTPESTARAAEEFQIPKSFDNWTLLVEDPDVDAVMIGTWPYLHCPITLAALTNGKHVLTEARMARNLPEARSMLRAANEHPDLVTQIVPSPFGLRAGATVKRILASGEIGELREFVVVGAGADFANPEAPLHWRQQFTLSGINMLALGILHESLIRWIPEPVRVLAMTKTFDRRADRPDCVRVMAETKCGAQGLYQLSGVAHHGDGFRIELYGTKGTLKYLLTEDRLLLGYPDEPSMREVDVPEEEAGQWQVEKDFVDAIRSGTRPRLTDFETGVRYMAFTDAVERSAHELRPVVVES